ncbi:uncharacterized protein F5147DRAFT_771427 [Suillus discolor]|uniref:Uncharacterized protein n=1 Tax=Suillus discolor TaxID=1912936 RepID=A0A9P7FBH9_9AGAM|nr:uncharacterized protein F5147DRAFT_771427 [Suillus discolor]KAG2112361.1 hypothetical protein F5147DRAFT_771427 [Suillus discolor]
MSDAGDEVFSDAGDGLSSIYSTESQYQCFTSTDTLVAICHALEEDPIDWWGIYVPLESWIPPRPESMPTFRGIIGLESYPNADDIPIAAYRFCAELLHYYEYRSDSMGKKEKNYELCFNGDFDEVTSMLSDPQLFRRFPNNWRSRRSIIGRKRCNIGKLFSPMIPTIADGPASLNEVSVADPYDCGWEADTTAPEDALMPAEGDVTLEARSPASLYPVSPAVDNNPYDCGWDGPIVDGPASSIELSKADSYDCRWEDDGQALEKATTPGETLQNGQPEEIPAPSLNQMRDEVMQEPIPIDDPYNCGWDNSMVNGTASPNESATADPYNCGWNGEIATEEIPRNESTADPYDCGWEDTITPLMIMSSEDRLDVRRDEGEQQSSRDSTDFTETADPYDCGWDRDAAVREEDTMLGDITDAPYGYGWGDFPKTAAIQNPSHHDGDDSRNGDKLPMARFVSDALDLFADDGMHTKNMLLEAEKDSTEDLYDCRWDDLMDDTIIMQQLEERDMREETNVIDLTLSEGGDVIDLTLLEGDVIDLTLPEGGDVIDITSTSVNSRRSISHNVFETAEKSMRRAIGRLNSIGHDNFDQYVCSIVEPAAGCVPDPQPAITFMANRNLFGAYTEARDRVTELGTDVINIHRLLNIHRRIMEPLDATITSLEQRERRLQ